MKQDTQAVAEIISWLYHPTMCPCNDPGAYGKIFKLYLWKSVNSDLRATKNRQLFQFNGILFKVVQVVQNKIEAYPFLGQK